MRDQWFSVRRALIGNQLPEAAMGAVSGARRMSGRTRPPRPFRWPWHFGGRGGQNGRASVPPGGWSPTPTEKVALPLPAGRSRFLKGKGRGPGMAKPPAHGVGPGKGNGHD